jgi:gliding motility-associated protein GldM
MSLPKEPRQLMINLMYLVLTALLAMNVSSEILNAFKIMDKSLIRSNKTAEERNTGVTELFGKFLEDDKASVEKKKKVSDALVLAEQVNTKTSAMVADLEKYKKMIIEASGGYDATGELKQMEYLDGGTHVMIEQKNGEKLLKAMQDYKSQISGLVPLEGNNIVASGDNPTVFKQLPLDFTVEKNDENKGDWSYANFHMSPTIANIALLNKYKNDVLASQSIALENIWSIATGEKAKKITLNPQVFTDYAIIVSADNSYLLPGEKYHARVVMGTYNKKLKNLTFNINGRNVVPVDGVADFTDFPSGNGPKNINVTASFTDTVINEDGSRSVKPVTVKLPQPVQYFVGEAQASISLDKMNVFYIGVANPVTIAASGIPADKVVATGENCTLTKVAGVNKYEVFTEKTGKAKITLSGTKADGTNVVFGTYEYRVKYLPDPVPYVAAKRGGKAGVSEMQNQIGMIAKLEGSEFDVQYRVISFDIYHHPRRGEDQAESSNSLYLTGNQASAPVRAIMEKLDVGSKLYFDNIKAVGPDKKVRNIGSMVFNIAY